MFRLLIFLFVVISLAACSNSSKRRNTPYLSSNSSVPFSFKPSLPTGTEGNLKTAPVPLANQLTTANSSQSTISTASPTTVSASTSTTNAGVNPSHGQPGHRCDLAVGAPLNNAVITASNTKPVTSQQVVTTQPAPPVTAKAKTSNGVNPSHGQPGHRCDIAVGAPLNGGPALANSASNTITTTPATGQQTTTAANTVLPVLNHNNTVDKNVKLNPAHGQPGHDCSIAVGQPLKK